MKWEQFFRDNNIPYMYRGERLVCNCPHHANDTDFFMRVYDTGVTTCWMCGPKSGVSTIQEMLGGTKDEATRIYKEYTGDDKVYREKVLHIHAKDLYIPGKLFTPVEKRYLRMRGITDDMINIYDIRSGGITDYFAYRIVFPIKDIHGHTISLRGRTVVDAKPKYKALPPYQELDLHKNHLYNEHLVEGNKLVVVEGEIDSIKGGPGFVGTFGSDITTKQLIKIAKYDTVLWLRDNDEAGRIACERVTNQLSALSNTHVEEIVMKDYKDVGSLDEALIRELRQEIDY